MIDTIIKGTGNSRSIKSVPNLAALAPNYDKLLELLTSEDGLPIDMGALNPLGCDVVGTPLNAANLYGAETGHYIGNGYDGPEFKNSIQLQSIPRFIIIFGYGNYGFGFIKPYVNDDSGELSCTGASISQGPKFFNLYCSIDGNKLSWYADRSSNARENAAQQLNQYSTRYDYFCFQ